MRRIVQVLVIVCLMAVGFVAQFALRAQRMAAAPALAEGAFAALGGLRSIMAEIIWFRADRLQEEGRYVELAQLASSLTLMEPHTPEVWSYSAWNLAYNVSVMMNSAEDRWRWVYSGIRLLRDEGIRYNPTCPELYRELAWLFELKLGTNIDSAAETYRAKWKAMIEDVKVRGTWEELGMDPSKMAEIEHLTGFDDWTNPLLSAIYWAVEGAKFAKDKELALLREIARQSALMYRKSQPVSP